jgi:hypothetical protein
MSMLSTSCQLPAISSGIARKEKKKIAKASLS